MLRSDTPIFLSGNALIATGLSSGPALDVGAQSNGQTCFYQVMSSDEGNPEFYDLNLPRPTPVITTLTPDTIQSSGSSTQVTIGGFNFGEAGSGQIVMFGSTIADVDSTTAMPTQITVTVPADVVTSDVVVCVLDNCSNSKRFTVTVGAAFEDISSIAFEPGTGSLWLGDRGTVDTIFELDTAGVAHARSVLSQFESKLTNSGGVVAGAVATDEDSVISGSPGDGAGSAYVFVRSGSTWTEQQKLTASDGMNFDSFGGRVSIDGDTAVISASRVDVLPEIGQDVGAAYVFVRNGTTWTEQQKLTSSDPQSNGAFGSSVSVDGNTVVIGAKGEGDGGVDLGAAYVFVRSGSTWTEQQRLVATDGKAYTFGFDVSVDGNTIVVGDPDNVNAAGTAVPGAAYVFVRNGTTWTEQQKLTVGGGEGFDVFGESVSVDGDIALIGSYSEDDFTGAAYVFTRNGTTWTEQQRLTASDAATDDQFGDSVSVDGERAFVGAACNSDAGLCSGSVYEFARNGTTWTEQQKLTASDASSNVLFGVRTAFKGDIVAVSAHGTGGATTYVFEVPEGVNDPFVSNLSPGDGAGRAYFANGPLSDFNRGGIRFVDSSDDSNTLFRSAGDRGTDPVWVRGLVAEDDGNPVVYVLDGNNNTVRRVPETGVIDNNWGNTGVLSFNNPAGGRLDSVGNLYVSSTTAVYKIAPDETVTLVADGFTGAAGIDLSEETGFPVLLVADKGAGAVYLVDATDGGKELIGNGFSSPVSAVFSEANGELFYDVAEATRIIRLPDPRVEFALPKGRTRVLMHKHRSDDTYPDMMRQKNEGEISIEVTVISKAPTGGSLYFRLIDPKNDNKGGPGTLGGCVGTPCMAPYGPDGKIKLTLTITPTFGGDNYQIEASFKDEPFKKAGRTKGVVEAWKRAYVEYDRMYKTGAGEFINQDSGNGQSLVYVPTPSAFPVDAMVHVMSGFDAATVKGEFGIVRMNSATDHIVVDTDPGTPLNDPLINLYGASTSTTHPFSFVALAGDAYDIQPSTTVLAEAFDDAFVEWLRVDGSSFLPSWPVINENDIDSRSFFFFKNLDRGTVMPEINHIQLVAAGALAAPDDGDAGKASSGKAWSWVFTDTIASTCVGCTSTQEQNYEHSVNAHECAHQWDVNPTDTKGHCTQTAWNDLSRGCLMNSPIDRPWLGVPRLHKSTGPTIPDDLYCIRGHVDDLNQESCTWPP